MRNQIRGQARELVSALLQEDEQLDTANLPHALTFYAPSLSPADSAEMDADQDGPGWTVQQYANLGRKITQIFNFDSDTSISAVSAEAVKPRFSHYFMLSITDLYAAGETLYGSNEDLLHGKNELTAGQAPTTFTLSRSTPEKFLALAKDAGFPID